MATFKYCTICLSIHSHICLSSYFISHLYTYLYLFSIRASIYPSPITHVPSTPDNILTHLVCPSSYSFIFHSIYWHEHSPYNPPRHAYIHICIMHTPIIYLYIMYQSITYPSIINICSHSLTSIHSSAHPLFSSSYSFFQDLSWRDQRAGQRASSKPSLWEIIS